MTASGAGDASRRALGTAVFGGMIAATVLGVFFIPVFYVAIQRFSEWIRRPKSGFGKVEKGAAIHTKK